jgi:cytochrome c-type biogenesis protein CcmH
MTVLRALAVAVLVVLAVVPATARADTPSAASLEEQIVCPTCRTTVALSDAPVARRIKLFIRERIAAGDSGDEIKAKLVSQFGAAVLAEPERKGLDLVAWVLPAAGLAIGALGVGALALAWSRRRAVADEEPLDPELEELLDEELARYDDPV